MLEHLESTLERLAGLVHPGLYRAQEADARSGLAQAEADWRAQIDGPQETEALGIYLKLLAFEVNEYFAGVGLSSAEKTALRTQVVLDTLAALQPEAQTETARVLRARTLFQIACMADRSGLRELSPAEGDALATQIPAVDRDNAFWSYLSGWAFDHRRAEQMFEAYTEFLVHRKPSLSRYNWERLRLMYLLTTGQAIFRDVEAVLDRLPNKVKGDSFAAHIQPRCEEAGVWDERLQMLFEIKLMDLGDRETEPLPPGLDRRFRRHPWDDTDAASFDRPA